MRTKASSEIRKARPCLVVSPNELNNNLVTVIVAPMTTGGYAYPFRPVCRFAGKTGRVALDQIRTVDRDGARAAPPEDAGGTPGYQEAIVAYSRRADEEDEAVVAWLGEDFDPELFDRWACNHALVLATAWGVI